ncbi:MAG: hypothetical protein EPN36_10150 [Rhodanobacteraceae bacterium]|nr:MAG: hypothetical protein EPN36_10150 [Rhodanobacteraceae bacterium]
MHHPGSAHREKPCRAPNSSSSPPSRTRPARSSRPPAVLGYRGFRRIRGQGRDGRHAHAITAETVRNLDPWYKAFDVQPGQKMYLQPAQRVKIW